MLLVILAAVGMALVYLLPTIVAHQRNHASLAAIFVVNLFLGWTLLGWVVALAWAFAASATKVAQPARVVRQASTDRSGVTKDLMAVASIVAVVGLSVAAILLNQQTKQSNSPKLNLPDSVEVAADTVDLSATRQGKWFAGEKRNPLDDSLTEVLREDSENNGDSLAIQCYHGRVDVILGVWAKKNAPSKEEWIDIPVRVRFDKGAQETQTWRFFPTTLGDWAASANPDRTAERLARSKSFIVGYTNDTGNTSIDVFDVTNLQHLLSRVTQACRPVATPSG